MFAIGRRAQFIIVTRDIYGTLGFALRVYIYLYTVSQIDLSNIYQLVS